MAKKEVVKVVNNNYYADELYHIQQQIDQLNLLKQEMVNNLKKETNRQFEQEASLGNATTTIEYSITGTSSSWKATIKSPNKGKKPTFQTDLIESNPLVQRHCVETVDVIKPTKNLLPSQAMVLNNQFNNCFEFSIKFMGNKEIAEAINALYPNTLKVNSVVGYQQSIVKKIKDMVTEDADNFQKALSFVTANSIFAIELKGN